jgi:hypothetical protein
VRCSRRHDNTCPPKTQKEPEPAQKNCSPAVISDDEDEGKSWQWIFYTAGMIAGFSNSPTTFFEKFSVVQPLFFVKTIYSPQNPQNPLFRPQDVHFHHQ